MSSISQSVGRTLKVFEAFAAEKRPLSASEIALFIAAPRSSCAALLKALCDEDVISIDRRTSSYFPTARFAELGAWIADGSIYPSDLLELMATLREETGETVTLAAYNDLLIELVQVERSAQAISFTAEKGQKFPIWGTGVGTAYLTLLDNSQIRALYRRSEARRMIAEKTPRLDDILHIVAKARTDGYAVAEGAVFRDASAVSAPLGIEVNLRQLVVSITGPTNRMAAHYDPYGERLCQLIKALPFIRERRSPSSRK